MLIERIQVRIAFFGREAQYVLAMRWWWRNEYIAFLVLQIRAQIMRELACITKFARIPESHVWTKCYVVIRACKGAALILTASAFAGLVLIAFVSTIQRLRCRLSGRRRRCRCLSACKRLTSRGPCGSDKLCLDGGNPRLVHDHPGQAASAHESAWLFLFCHVTPQVESDVVVRHPRGLFFSTNCDGDAVSSRARTTGGA